MSLKKIFIVFFISILFLSINCVYASDSIVSVSSTTVGLNTDFYIILNLSNITYTKFKVEISNASSLQPSEITSGVTSVSKSGGNMSFIVDKNSIGLDKLAIVYTSPSSATKINFNVTITSLDSSMSDLQEKIDNLNTELTTLSSNLESLKTQVGSVEEGTEEYEELSTKITSIEESITSKTQEITSLQEQITNYEEETVSGTISVEVKNQETTTPDMEGMEFETSDKENQMNKSPWGDMDSMLKDKMQMENDEMSNSMKEMMSKMSGLEQSLESANMTISSLTAETNVYQGSQNNYLSSLSITGVELKNEFKKTTSNYFAEVGSDITSVTVNAVPEDSDSVVTIYGNTNLQSGKNKVIISVTAEDGSVRNYKIYITK